MGKPSEERARKIVELIGDLVEDDEHFVVAREDGELAVSPADERPVESTLRTSHPALYAVLLRAEARMDSWGCGWILLWVIVFLGVFHAFHFTGHIEDVSFFLYPSVVTLGIGFGVGLGGLRERAAYRRARHEVLEAIRGSGLPFDSVILAIQGHDDVDDVGKCLMREDIEKLRREWGIS